MKNYGRLSDTMQKCVDLAAGQNLGDEQIAERLDISLAYVRSLLSQARGRGVPVPYAHTRGPEGVSPEPAKEVPRPNTSAVVLWLAPQECQRLQDWGAARGIGRDAMATQLLRTIVRDDMVYAVMDDRDVVEGGKK